MVKYLKRVLCSKSKCDQLIKRILDLQCNIQDHEEEAHTYKNQANCKNPTQLLTYGTEYKVVLLLPEFFRGTLAQPHPKPSAGANGKQ